MVRNALLALPLVVGLVGCASKVSPEDVSADAVTARAIANRAVTNPKLADGAVDQRVIAAGAVGREQLVSGAISATQLADGAVVSRTLADGAVVSRTLADGTVVSRTLADGAVASRALAAGAVGTDQLGEGAVTAAKLAPSAAVLGLNGLSGQVTIAAGNNLSITAADRVLTVGLQGPVDAATLGGVGPEDLLRLSGDQVLSGVPTFGASATPPFVVASDQRVQNLNADLLDGEHATTFARKVNNVIQVAKTGGDFTSIQAAIESIEDASATNRYLIRVAPGTYEESVGLREHVYLRGAGVGLTIVHPPPGYVAVNLLDDTSLEGLSVRPADEEGSMGVMVFSGSASLRDVEITAALENDKALVEITPGSVWLDHVKIESTGSYGVGIFMGGPGALQARDSVVRAAVAVYGNSGPLSFASSELEGFRISAGGLKCVGSYDAAFNALGANCQAP